jgi:hypothetical protein
MSTNNVRADRLALSVPELASALGLSHPPVYKFISHGALAPFTFGSCPLISRESADKVTRAREHFGLSDVGHQS